MLTTKRLILRRWKESDAADLYTYAKDPAIGPAAGWQVHTSVEQSRETIKNVLNGAECELGYWIAKPFWGQGLIPEAAKEMLRRAFEDLKMSKVWCGYYDGNEKSKRVQEKLGFKYQYTKDDVFVPAFNETRTEHMSCITKEEWENNEIL